MAILMGKKDAPTLKQDATSYDKWWRSRVSMKLRLRDMKVELSRLSVHASTPRVWGSVQPNLFLQLVRLEAPEKHHSLHPFRDKDTIESCSNSNRGHLTVVRGDLALLLGVTVLWS